MEAVMTRRKFTSDEYHRMAVCGILWPDERVELSDGEVVKMPPIGDDHLWCVNHLTRALVLGLGDRAVISVQNPIRLSEHWEPQPDITLLRAEIGERRSFPWADDVLLLIEIADTTLKYDRTVKLPRYAAAGISEMWIVDLKGRRIEVYREPEGDSYRSMTVHERDSVLSPAAFPDVRLRCDEIVG